MKKTVVYKGRVISLCVYKGLLNGRRVQREVVEHGGAAAVIAFDEDGRLIMVRQHRFPYGETLEIPAGTLDGNEDPVDCAFRELREETGYGAKRMAHLITVHPSIGYNTEAIHCYVASGVCRVSGQSLDEDEVISVQKVAPRRAVQMIRSGRIQDAKTICAVMTYASKKRMVF